ncbi:MAG: nucleotidyltransferase domain-containing protein [Chlamydiales bacterium]|nr:nucleotidyltransferase domain-containing protein [Chlamydiales bacterium]
MNNKFDSEEAKNFLLAREEREKQQREEERTSVLPKVVAILEKEFKGSSVEVYLIGSILKPFGFSSRSDVDIVLKNYKDDRFDFWAKLERKLGRKVEIILFETCSFQEFVLKGGFKVV